jgi:hypothetical protein
MQDLLNVGWRFTLLEMGNLLLIRGWIIPIEHQCINNSRCFLGCLTPFPAPDHETLAS